MFFASDVLIKNHIHDYSHIKVQITMRKAFPFFDSRIGMIKIRCNCWNIWWNKFIADNNYSFIPGKMARKNVHGHNMRLLSLFCASLGRSPALNTQILAEDHFSRLAMRKNGIKGKFKLEVALITVTSQDQRTFKVYLPPHHRYICRSVPSSTAYEWMKDYFYLRLFSNARWLKWKFMKYFWISFLTEWNFETWTIKVQIHRMKFTIFIVYFTSLFFVSFIRKSTMSKYQNICFDILP